MGLTAMSAAGTGIIFPGYQKASEKLADIATTGWRTFTAS
jgi:hypothetical protein